MAGVSVRLAAQAYTVRHLPGTATDQLRACAEAGFEAIESVETHGMSAATFRAVLDDLGLTLASVHVPLQRVRCDPDAVLDDLERLEVRHAVVPWLPPEDRGPSEDDWARLGRELAGFGRRCRERGVQCAFHAHDVEMQRLDGGRLAIEVLLDAGDPDDLAFEPDLAWIVRGGADPLALLRRFEGRCPLVHLKDLARPGADPREEGWAAPGDGVLDWSALLPATVRAGAEWWIVEHDAPVDPVATLRRGHRFVGGMASIR